jgi:hypothetical protein
MISSKREREREKEREREYTLGNDDFVKLQTMDICV